jgi:hypothetical protein
MKLRELEEAKDQMTLIVEWIAQRIVREARNEAAVQQEVKGIAADADMLHKEAKTKLKDLMDKVDIEIYHLLFR